MLDSWLACKLNLSLTVLSAIHSKANSQDANSKLTKLIQQADWRGAKSVQVKDKGKEKLSKAWYHNLTFKQDYLKYLFLLFYF